MHTFSRCLAMIFAWILGAFETWIFIMTDEYWPLSFNDYIAIIAMLWCAKIARIQSGVVFLSACWAFIVGNFYALIISYVPSATSNTVIKLSIMSVFFSVAVIGLITSLISGFRFFKGNTRIV